MFSHLLTQGAVALAVSAAFVAAAHAQEPLQETLREVVVTASRMASPLIVETDPHQPRQPLPAHDGADFLKTIPGFNAIRKGGTDGDPVFRGMAASRVNILLDGEQVLGGCGMRMDPPTAYIFPEAFDSIVVVKGPQTVLNGPGNSAATVRFESRAPAFDPARWRASLKALDPRLREDDGSPLNAPDPPDTSPSTSSPRSLPSRFAPATPPRAHA